MAQANPPFALAWPQLYSVVNPHHAARRTLRGKDDDLWTTVRCGSRTKPLAKVVAPVAAALDPHSPAGCPGKGLDRLDGVDAPASAVTGADANGVQMPW